MVIEPTPNVPEQDLAQHTETYKWFVRGVAAVAVHALVILLVLAYVFSDGMG